jgi:16S rRNA (guanine1516-N2)-methyltransferase
MDRGVLSIRDRRGRGLKALSVDLDAPEPASKKQLLGRAVGRRTRDVVDATAGWGDDSRRLRAMGYSVTMLERNPVMAALLRNAANRVASPPEVVECEAIDYLAEHPAAWDCVYLDPMFPPKRRSSTLARRRMRLLRELAGDDPDRDELFAAAMTAAAKRVVVKRPDHHGPLAGTPAETVAGKLVCYDVYFAQGGRA